MAPHHLLSPARCSQHQNPVSLLWALLIWSYPKAAEMLLQLRNGLQLPLGILQNLLLDNKTYFFFLRPKEGVSSQLSVLCDGPGEPSPHRGSILPKHLFHPLTPGRKPKRKPSQGPGSLFPSQGWVRVAEQEQLPQQRGSQDWP